MKFTLYFFTWFVALTTIVKGSYKSCEEIKVPMNSSGASYLITIGGKSVEVSCNLTSQPAETIIPFNQVVQVSSNVANKVYNVDYGDLSAVDIRAFVEQSEICKQYVSYKCSNATVLDKQFPLLSWTSTEDTPIYYWAGCSFSDKTCRCDSGKGIANENLGYLTKKKDLPLKSLQFGTLPSGSNISVKVGNIACYGDSQKDAFAFEDRNAFVSLNVSSMKELKFKFKTRSEKSKVIANVQGLNSGKKNFTMELNDKSRFIAGFLPSTELDEEWHSIVLSIENKEVCVSLDNSKKKTAFESVTSTVGAKLVLGDPDRKCKTFFGCVKDLTVDGEDYTAMIREATMKEFVKEGCKPPKNGGKCSPATPTTAAPSSEGKKNNTDKDGDVGPTTAAPSSGGKKNNTNKDGDVGDEGHGNNDDAAIIAIVVVFLIVLIILIVVFFITWYLKRNKGVYQTHEGSAENIHGDADNLTLVTKPCDQEAEADKGKEYYL